MGKPLTIQLEDEALILRLKAKMGFRTKIDVVRAGLTLLAEHNKKKQRIAQWKRATQAAIASSEEVNQDFRTSGRFAHVSEYD